MRIITLHPVTVTRAEVIAAARWPEHDPGDEDEPSWLTAPAAPLSDFMRACRRLWYGDSPEFCPGCRNDVQACDCPEVIL